VTPTVPVREKDWQHTIVEAAQVLGYRVYHTRLSVGSSAGYPDLTIVGRSPKDRPRCIFAEVKTERGKVSESQADWITWLQECGFEAYIWRPSDWPIVEKVLKDEV
jgi:hypothetical protein